MAINNYWVGASGDYKWSTVTNWSKGHIPTTGETAYFTDSGAYNCTVDANVSGFTYITFDTKYNKAFNDGGKTVVSMSGITINTSGNFAASGTWTLKNDGDFSCIVAGTATTQSWNVDLKGTGKFILGKNSTKFNNLTCAYAGKTTGNISDTTLGPAIYGVLTIGTGTFTLKNYIYLYASTGAPFVNGGGTVTLNAANEFQIYAWKGNTVTIPAVTMGGGYLNLTSYSMGAGSDAIFNLNGAVSTQGFYCFGGDGATNFSTTVNTQNNSITAPIIQFGSNAAAGKTLTVNMGSSVVDCNSFNSTTWNTNTTVIELDTSTWTIGADCDIGSNTTINDTSTATWTFDSTTAVTLTSAGKTLPSLVVKKTGGGFTASDALTCYNFTVHADNNQAVSWSGFTLTSTTSVTIDGTGTLNMGNGVTVNGASGTLHLGAALGAVTATSCVITMNGTTGMTFDDDLGASFKAYVHGANAIVTNSGGATSTFSSSTTPLTFTNGGTLTLTQSFSFRVSGSVDAYSITGSPTIDGAGYLFIFAQGGVTINAPAITVGGSVKLRFDIGNATTNGITQTGIINAAAFQLAKTYNSSSAILSYSTGNFGIVAGTGGILIGNNLANGSVTLNCGSSTIDCNGPFETTSFNSGTTVIELDTSTWTFAGDFDLGTNTTINDPTTCVGWTFDSTTACTLISAGKTLPKIVVSKTGGGFTISDNTACQNFSVALANNQAVSWAGFTLTVTGTENTLFNGTGTLNMGNGLTVNGNNSIGFYSGIGAVTASSCVLTMTGTTNCGISDDKGVNFKSLVLGANAIMTKSGGATTGFSSATTPITFTNGGTLTINAPMRADITASAAWITITAGTPTINGSSTLSLRTDIAAGGTGTLPALTLTGTLSLTITTGNTSVGNVIQLNGALVVPGTFMPRAGNANGAIALTTQNYAITCGALTYGSSQATATFTMNCGSSVIDVNGNIDGTTYNTGATTLELDTSTWTISGDVDLGSNLTINDPTTCNGWTFDGTTALSLTSAGKTLPALTFNKTVGAITLSDALACYSFAMVVTNTSSFNDGGFAVTITSTVSINSGGAFTATGTWTQTGNGNFTLTASTSWTITSWKIDLQGTGALANNSGSTRTISKITGAAAGKVTTHNGSNQISTVQWTLGAGEWANSRTLACICSAIGDLSFNVGHAISGSTQISLYGNVAGITVNIPQINASGFTGTLQLGNVALGNTIISLQGAIVTGGALNFGEYYGSGTRTATLNTNNYAITAGGAVSIGTSDVTGICICTFGSSVIDFNSSFNTTTMNLGSTTLNLGTSTWTIAGDCDIGNNTTLNNITTSTWTYDGTAAVGLISQGKTLPALVVAKTGGGFALGDVLTCYSFNVSAANNQAVNFFGMTLTVTTGNCLFDGSGTLNCGNGITVNGASATVHFGTTLGAVTATSCILTLNGTTGMTHDDDKAVMFKQYVIGANAIVTMSGGTYSYVRSNVVPLVVGASASLTINCTFLLGMTASNDCITQGAGSTITGTGTISILANANSIEITVPALTLGCGLSLATDGNSLTGWSYRLTGTLNVGAKTLICGTANNNNTATWNFNNQNITCGAFTFGISGAATGTTVTANYGSGTFNISSFTGTYNTAGTYAENFQTSQWLCSGSWTFGTNHTIDPGTSLVTITNTATITTNTKTLYDLTINADTKTITLADNLTLAAGGDLTITAGTLNTATFTVSVGANLTDSVGTTFRKLVMAGTSTKRITVGATKTMTLSTLVNTDLNGGVGGRCELRSSVTGTRFTIAVPNIASFSYMDVKDCIASGFRLTANDGTSITRLNNVNWRFMSIASISPDVVKLAGGDTVTVTDGGTGISGVCTVSVASTAGSGVVVTDSQHLNFVTPPKPSGTYNLTVVNGDLESGVLVSGITYDNPPIISYLSPTGGTFLGGTTLSIFGTGFNAVQSSGYVLFNSTPPASYVLWSENRIDVITPAMSAPGTVNVTVVDLMGSSTTLVNGYTFTGAGTYYIEKKRNLFFRYSNP